MTLKHKKMKIVIRNSLYLLIFLFSLTSFAQRNTIEEKSIEDMKYMYEEEKLAHDAYVFLGEKWDLQIFQNIKESEKRHLKAIEGLLTKNQISYTLYDKKGKFHNVDLQKLYDYLIELGSNSVKDALSVGALIEETDINDLEKAIDNTNDEYRKQVYSNLLRASRNHLRAFKRQLSRY